MSASKEDVNELAEQVKLLIESVKITNEQVEKKLPQMGGPQFTSGVTQEFLASWRVHHRLCSVANPHANTRAEIAVKTIKRMLMTM